MNSRQRAGSLTSLEDLIKRKRENVAEEIDIFKRCKKITRSPDKVKEIKKPESEMESVLKALAELKTDLKQEIKEASNNLKEEINKKFADWQNEKQELNKKIEKLEKRVESFEKREEEREKRARKNNIVISGLQVGDERKNIEGTVTDFIKATLNINTSFKAIELIKRKQKPDLIVATLNSFNDKIEIMKRKVMLKGNKNVYIDEDLSKKEREIQMKIRQKARIERSKGNVVKVGYQKIAINGVWQKWKEEEEEKQE